MNAQELLQEISDYCRQTGLAESTFGRRAVNDGKLTARLRNGGRITTETLDRIRGFMETNRHGRRHRAPDRHRARARAAPRRRPAGARCRRRPAAHDPQRNFRFFDNRQKYLLFVNTCSEKWVVAQPRRDSSSPTSIRARRRCACSTPASATAPCCCG